VSFEVPGAGLRLNLTRALPRLSLNPACTVPHGDAHPPCPNTRLTTCSDQINAANINHMLNALIHVDTTTMQSICS